MDRALTAPTGVRLVLANCTDLARDDEFNAWYDEYATSLTEPGFFVDAARYRDAGAEGDPQRPTYVSIYGIETADPGAAWPRTYEWWEERGGHALTPLLQVPYRATYTRLAGPGPGTEWPQLAVRLADAAPGCEQEAEGWYRALGSGPSEVNGALTTYLLVDGSPEPPRFLELLGTRGSAEDAYAELQSRLDDETRERGAALLRQRSIGFFDRVFSYPPSSTARSVARAAKGA
jgi:hypothetical protein